MANMQHLNLDMLLASAVPVLDPASKDAGAIGSLFLIVALICGVIFVVMVTLICASLWRSRNSANETPPQNFGYDCACDECLIAFIGCELNPQIAACCLRVQEVGMSLDAKSLLPELLCQLLKSCGNDYDIGIQRIDRFDVAIDRQPANHAIRA